MEQFLDSHLHNRLIIDAGGQNACLPYEIRQIDSISAIQQAILEAKYLKKKISIFGMRHSQAGQICHEGSIALDMNSYNKIIHIDQAQSQITVESGIQWREIQSAIQPYGLAVQVMQFVNTFTVAWSMSANIFSRDPSRSRLIETIISFTLVDASGEVRVCSRKENYELFTLVIEGHGLFGVIAEVTIQLTTDIILFAYTFYNSPEQYIDNLHHKDKASSLVYHNAQYVLHRGAFMQQIISNSHYSQPQSIGPPENVLTRHEMMTGTREMELTFWNLEASDALLGFFIPVPNFFKFQSMLQNILQETQLHVFKCSMNYLLGNHESFISTPRGPCIKFAIFYRHKKSTKEKADKLKKACADATVECCGTLYLTFDFLASSQQMDVFYPKWRDFLAKKLHYDPEELFCNRFYERLSGF
jgi:decaprenylphospho-beta-D-ribofuranose 2-oxidase